MDTFKRRLCCALKLLALFLFSWTRIIANILKRRFGDCGRIYFFVLWNAFFIAIAIVLGLLLNGVREAGWLLGIASALAYFRINELLIAFYADSMTSSRKSPTPNQRVGLLTMSYVEVILQFAIIHYVIRLVWGDGAYKDGFSNIFESVYFSVMTVTTTGYGDIAPVNWAARIAAGYEALVGIVLIAFALASYLSRDRTIVLD